MPRSAVGSDEEQSGVRPRRPGLGPPGFPRAEVGAQDRGGGGAERDGAVPGVGLHGFGDGLVLDGGDLLGDGEVGVVEVDVLVAQPARLAAA